MREFWQNLLLVVAQLHISPLIKIHLISKQAQKLEIPTTIMQFSNLALLCLFGSTVAATVSIVGP